MINKNKRKNIINNIMESKSFKPKLKENHNLVN